jgi:hypothetical protein
MASVLYDQAANKGRKSMDEGATSHQGSDSKRHGSQRRLARLGLGSWEGTVDTKWKARPPSSHYVHMYVPFSDV